MWRTPPPVGEGPWPVVKPRDRRFFRDALEVLYPESIVEFGSWEGASALAWASQANETGISVDIYCVDTWLGSPEHWQNLLPNTEWGQERLRIVNGEPGVFDTFKQAIDLTGHSDRIAPLRATTECGTSFLLQHGVRPDLVYVDADHSYPAVRRDLALASSLLSDRGLLTGDDWHHEPIQRAVMRHAVQHRLDILTDKDQDVFILVPKSSGEQMRQAWLDRGYVMESIPKIAASQLRNVALHVRRSQRP